VNAFIRQNSPVETRIMTPDDARAIGAQALFGEKYGDEVRVVSMGSLDGSGKGADGKTYSALNFAAAPMSRAPATSGRWSCLSESASSAGVRRIEALTGQAALDHLRQQDARLNDIAAIIKAPAAELADRIRRCSMNGRRWRTRSRNCAARWRWAARPLARKPRKSTG
jgi:alanyl-tRNA synthetase